VATSVREAYVEKTYGLVARHATVEEARPRFESCSVRPPPPGGWVDSLFVEGTCWRIACSGSAIPRRLGDGRFAASHNAGVWKRI
jgi:hypothetical protein